MFRKVPHLRRPGFLNRRDAHDNDLLTQYWGINRAQLLWRRMDSGGDTAQIQRDRFLKGNIWSVLRPHSITNSALSDLHMEAFLKSESRLHKCNTSILCDEHHLPGRSIKWARDETQLKDRLIAMETDGLQERPLRFDKVMGVFVSLIQVCTGLHEVCDVYPDVLTRIKRGRLESPPWVSQGFGTVFLCSWQAEFCTNGATIYI